MVDQRLKGLADLHVLLIAPLIEIEFFALDAVEPRSSFRSSTRLSERLFGDRSAILVLRVVRPLPREPVRRPSRVRVTHLLERERKHAARSTVEHRAFAREQATHRGGQRIPDEQRARVRPRRLEPRRERLQDGQRPAARGRLAPRADLRRDSKRSDRDRGSDDQRSEDQAQYCRTVWICSPGSLARPFSATSSMRNASACTCPPSRFTSSVVARAVPPVASRSSTISTRCPRATPSSWISSASVPYSRS